MDRHEFGHLYSEPRKTEHNFFMFIGTHKNKYPVTNVWTRRCQMQVGPVCLIWFIWTMRYKAHRRFPFLSLILSLCGQHISIILCILRSIFFVFFFIIFPDFLRKTDQIKYLDSPDLSISKGKSNFIVTVLYTGKYCTRRMVQLTSVEWFLQNKTLKQDLRKIF